MLWFLVSRDRVCQSYVFHFFTSLSTTWSTQKVLRFLLEKLQQLGAVSHLCVQNSLPINLIEISEFPTCVLCNKISCLIFQLLLCCIHVTDFFIQPQLVSLAACPELTEEKGNKTLDFRQHDPVTVKRRERAAWIIAWEKIS